MKTSLRFPSLFSSVPFRLLAGLVSLAAAAAALSAESAAPTPAAGPAKEYTLFMGTDFSVQKDKEYYRVRDVTGGNFIIKLGNKEVAVPMRAGSGTLKIDQGFKLSGQVARIEKLKAERAYTAENDPNQKFFARASSASAASDSGTLAGMAMDGANGQLAGANAQLAGAQRAGSASGISQAQGAISSATMMQNQARNNMTNSANFNMADINNPGLAALELQEELAEENFDAMRYSFELSSETPLGRPYLVFIVRYHEKNAKPGTGQGQVIYAKPIESVGPRPSKINILQTGMPVGFIVEETQVRLYNNGQEVATTVAPRRVEMTKDEAFLYLKLDRTARAKGSKQPAAPALGRPNEATRARLTNEQLGGTYYVKVTKEGRAEAVFTDTDCTRPADETVASVVREMRFFPALENGKEQPGVAKLVLPQVAI